MNKFGRIFSVEIFGESHGKVVGVIIDGVPPGIKIEEKDFAEDLNRRKAILLGSTLRHEDDIPEILSGIFNGFTTGSPILIQFKNKNINSKDYDNIKFKPRPSHADFPAYIKYKGYNDYRGGGHFSGRLTLGLVAAGVIAKKIISNVKINAKIININGNEIDFKIDLVTILKKLLQNNENILKDNNSNNGHIKKELITILRNDYVNVLNKESINNILNKIIKVVNVIKFTSEVQDSIGGIIECRIDNIKPGLGEPFFDSLESLLSHIIFSIPSIKGIEFGAGFKFANLKGSEANDQIIDISGKTVTNYSGGINGGISNGNQIIFRVVSKPAASIGLLQKTINIKTKKVENLKINGRHDSCIILRMPPIIEAAAAIVLADLFLIKQAYS